MIEQRTDGWFQLRAGKVTASRVADVMARTKTGPSASRANYAAQLVCERLTGTVEQGFTNSAMMWGTETEPAARNAYVFETGADVAEVGFVIHPSIAMAGASPDGLVGNDGLVEIKCPNTATHIETLTTERVPAKYVSQMQWQMACAGRAWCDFASFDPRLPAELRLFVKRVERDDALIAEMEREVIAFLAEVDATVAKLQAKITPPEPVGLTILHAI
jgi:putative phage-type endonuclease